MNVWLMIDLLLSLLARIPELIAEWRAARGDGNIEGVGSLSDRVDAIVKRQALRTDLNGLSPKDANDKRREDALRAMLAAGINLRERDRRMLLELSLIRQELNDQA